MLKRQRKCNCCSTFVPVLRPYRTTVGFDDALGNCKSQSRSTLGPASGWLSAVKLLKYPVEIVLFFFGPAPFWPLDDFISNFWQNQTQSLERKVYFTSN